MKPVIGIIAPSSVVPKLELELGVGSLNEAGFEVRVHPHTLRQDLFYAGTVEERAQALIEMALDPEVDAIWCARGGSGAFATLQAAHPVLKKNKARMMALGKAGKQILGYSDITAMLEYMSAQWGWRAVHCPMPTAREFSILPSRQRLLSLARGEKAELSYDVEWVSEIQPPRGKALRGKLIGGNLTVWSTLIGTPFQGRSRGSILFFEEITEAWYRIDRMMEQMHATGAFKGVRAIVLGTFTECPDPVMTVLDELPPKGLTPDQRAAWLKVVPQLPRSDGKKPARKGRPIRPCYPVDALLNEVFYRWSERLGIPVGLGLPCGHGSFGYEPLLIGETAELTRAGELRVTRK